MIGALEWSTKKLDRAGKKMEKAVYKRTLKAFVKIVTKFQADFTKGRLTKPGNPLEYGGSIGLHSREGGLRRGLVTRVKGSPPKTDTLDAAVGWWQPFQAMKANVHEYGATITPNRRTYLAVPMESVLTSTGRALFGYGPMDWHDTFVWKSKSGLLFIAQWQAGGDEIVPLYRLMKSVYVPPRLGFRAMWDSAKFRNYRSNTISGELAKLPIDIMRA
jgi:hypothetical protein